MEAVLSVSELTADIKKQLESKFGFVCVRGEISNLKEQTSGHLYFTLKDNASQISAVLFRGNTRNMKRLPKSGDQVVIKGELSVYSPRGNYQILVREVEFSGIGALLLKLHELKTTLEKRGWFNPALKKPLPKIPKTIGVVTSPTGSVIQDIINVLKRRFSGFHLILNPVKVQGEGAAEEIAAAIGQFNQYRLADLLIVGRGGGSLEDLWAFNEEKVAAAIYASTIPVISAVGHETDDCICDYVADMRAPTPSAAAEIAIAEKQKEIQALGQMKNRIRQTVRMTIQQHRIRLNGYSMHPLIATPYSTISKHLQLVDSMEGEMLASMKNVISQKKTLLLSIQKQVNHLKPNTQIRLLRQKLEGWERALNCAVQQKIAERRQRLAAFGFEKNITFRVLQGVKQKKLQLQHLANHLKAIDPKNLLTKGFCILFSENEDSVILSREEVKKAQNVRIRLHDGSIKATVNETTP